MKRERAEALRLYAIREESMEMVADVTAKLVCDYFDNERVKILPRRDKKAGFDIYVTPGQKIAFSIYPGYDGIKMKPLVLLRWWKDSTFSESVVEATTMARAMVEESLKHDHRDAA